MKRKLFSAAKWMACAAVAAFCYSCEGPKTNEKAAEAPSVPNIIFDTDLGNSTDDVLAMQALFYYRSQGKCNLAAVMNSRKWPKAQDLTDRFLHYYKADDIPLGLVEGKEQFFEIIPYYQLADSIKPDGNPLFPGTGVALSDRLPAWKLYRKVLGEAADNSITIVCVGMFTNLGLLLDSQADEFSPLSGAELVKKKVKCLEVMGGCFSKVKQRYSEALLEVEYNIGGDIALAKKVIDHWPTELRIFPVEVGLKYPSDHKEVLADYAWQPESPMYQIYARYNEWAIGDLGQYWWDAITLVHAILDESHFDCTKTGTVHISDDGHTTFSPDPSGNAHVVNVGPEHDYALYELLRSFAQYKP